MFFEHDDIHFERVRAKRRMLEKEESILFGFIGDFFQALFDKSNKKKSSKIENRKVSKKKLSEKQVQAASLGAVSNNSSTRNALFLIAIAGVAAASTYIVAKKVYSDEK